MTCNWIVRESELQASRTGWTHGRHKSYPTVDQPVAAIPAVSTFISTVLRTKLFPFIQRAFGLDSDELWLQDLLCAALAPASCPLTGSPARSVVKYESGVPDGQTMLATHRDGSLLSFNILLNFQLRQGEVITHCGKLRHSGNHITRGRRYILVGFVNATSRRLNPDLVSASHPFWHTTSLRVSDRWLLVNALRSTAGYRMADERHDPTAPLPSLPAL